MFSLLLLAVAADLVSVSLTKLTAGSKRKHVYAGELAVGGRPFRVVFDTGSGHLLLPGPTCTTNSCRQHNVYDPKKSSTGKEINYDGSPISTAPGSKRDSLTVNFGTGEVSGVFAHDRVCIGQTCVPLNILSATSMSDNPFVEFDFDGVCGLGLAGLSQTDQFNFAENLPSRVFAVSLAGSNPEITFGGWRPTQMAGPLRFVPVLDPEEGYWKLGVHQAKLNGAPIVTCEHGCNAVADTGTSVLAAPSDLVAALKAELDPQLVDGRCVGRGNMTLELDGMALVLTTADLAAPDGDRCRLLLMRMDIPPPLGPLLVLGEPVLTKYYTVFDVAAKQVGFALAKNPSPSPAHELTRASVFA